MFKVQNHLQSASHKKIYLNYRILSAEKAHLSAISSAALYGKGIFTTLAVYNAKPFLWEKHWSRLTENAEKIGIDLSVHTENNVKNALLEIISKNKIINARARITFFDESANGMWAVETIKRTSLLVTTGDFRPVFESFRVAVSPFCVNSTSPLAGVKSCNYLENTLALEDAKARGFDEAVRLNERGEIVSAGMGNIFWIKGKDIFTPSLETGCLKGTVRNLIMENFPVAEMKADFTELTKADTVFLTSSGLGIMRISNIGLVNFAELPELFHQIKNFFNNFTEKFAAGE